jgi:hypothetical protein
MQNHAMFRAKEVPRGSLSVCELAYILLLARSHPATVTPAARIPQSTLLVQRRNMTRPSPPWSEHFYKHLKDDFAFESRGLVEFEGKGEMQTWSLIGRNELGALVDPNDVA